MELNFDIQWITGSSFKIRRP